MRAATIANGNIMFIIFFYFFDEPHFLHILDNRFARLASFHAGILTGVVHHPTIIVYNLFNRNIVSLGNLKVDHRVGGGNFYSSRSEFWIDSIISDNFDFKFAQDAGNHILFADHILVPLVRGMDCNSRIAKLCLWSCSRQYKRTVLYPIKLSNFLFVINLVVSDRTVAARTPVNCPKTLINQTFVIETHESLVYSPRQPLVERKALTRPITARANRSQLSGDLTAILLFPLPNSLNKFFPSHLAAADSFFCQSFLNNSLRGNTRMVGSGKP